MQVGQQSKKLNYLTVHIRFRKLKHIEDLTSEVEQLKEERKELARVEDVLKQEVTSLRKKLDNHIVKGLCQIDCFDQITYSYL